MKKNTMSGAELLEKTSTFTKIHDAFGGAHVVSVLYAEWFMNRKPKVEDPVKYLYRGCDNLYVSKGKVVKSKPYVSNGKVVKSEKHLNTLIEKAKKRGRTWSVSVMEEQTLFKMGSKI